MRVYLIKKAARKVFQAALTNPLNGMPEPSKNVENLKKCISRKISSTQ